MLPTKLLVESIFLCQKNPDRFSSTNMISLLHLRPEFFESNCPKCQFENPEGMKFCGECGQSLVTPTVRVPKDLSFDEKLAKIQRYLPEGLTQKIHSQRDRIEGEKKQIALSSAIWGDSRPYRRDSGQRRCTASWTPEVNGLQLINGFRTVMPEKRLKSLSAVHSSRTPWKRQSAATRASWTCGPLIRPSSRALRSSGQ